MKGISRIWSTNPQKHRLLIYLPSDNYPSLMLTGEIPRKTSFEKGFPFQYVENQSGNEIKLVQIRWLETIKRS